MDHIQDIADLIQTVLRSTDFHALLLRGSAGLGKSTAVELALEKINQKSASLGSYSTPLNLFNFLYAHQNEIIVIDDCAGLFQSAVAMSIFKAATGTMSGPRVVQWGSTSARSEIDEFPFSGKIIFICNSFPHGPDADAVRSRSIPYDLSFTVKEASLLLIEAASSNNHYSDTRLALAVAEFLNSFRNEKNSESLNLRTLKMGYEVARLNSSGRWKELLIKQISLKVEPEDVVLSLAQTGLRSTLQAIEFEKRTGLKRRTFFKIRKELGLARSYDSRSG